MQQDDDDWRSFYLSYQHYLKYDVMDENYSNKQQVTGKRARFSKATPKTIRPKVEVQDLTQLGRNHFGYLPTELVYYE